MIENILKKYQLCLIDCIQSFDWSPVCKLASDILMAWKEGKHIFLCGNGGSAANAIHIANDFLFPFTKKDREGLKVTALPANQAVLTCLGNDIGYENIFSFQLQTLSTKGDILIALSGSGNSQNILNAVNTAKKMKVKSYAILGFNGGKCLSLADVAIHFSVDDMQIAEDLQLMVGHMLMQWFKAEVENTDERKNSSNRK